MTQAAVHSPSRPFNPWLFLALPLGLAALLLAFEPVTLDLALEMCIRDSNYPNAEVEWEFRCRNQEDLRLYLPAIREQLEYLAGLAISDEQLAFLERIPFLAPDFIRFLGLFRFNPRYVQTGIENDEFFLRLKGPWLHVILFEAVSYTHLDVYKRQPAKTGATSSTPSMTA